MANALIHAQSSVNHWGGKVEDYIKIHEWFDDTKAYYPDFRHRALKHHSLGIEQCRKKFGFYILNSDGKKVSVVAIGEQHVKEDCGFIPSVGDWLHWIQPQSFMFKAQKLSNNLKVVSK